MKRAAARPAASAEGSQLSLFGDAAARPPGLDFAEAFIGSAVEQTLLARLRDLPLAPFQFGAFEGKRRVASFGFHYDFTQHRLEAAEPIPDWLGDIVAAVEAFGRLTCGSVRQILCTEYEVGAGIGWHRDRPQFGAIFGLSLGAACTMRFRRRSGDGWIRYAQALPPRSLYRLDGEVRRDWEHSIAPVETLRYSITFRTMAK